MLFIQGFYILLCLPQLSYVQAGINVAGAATDRVDIPKKSLCDSRSGVNQYKPYDIDEADGRAKDDVFKRLQMRRKCSTGSLKSRDISPLDIDHYSHDPNARIDGNPTGFFNDTSSCMLQPEVDPGLFYENEEMIKFLLRESQPGFGMILDIQIVDSSTCEPIPGVLVDIWHCNATGVYSSVVAEGNGDNHDLENVNTSFFRGIRPTRQDGVAKFGTIIPGHYQSK